MSPKPRATRTMPMHKETPRDRQSAILLSESYPEHVVRPRTRGDCAPGPTGNGRRPCPFYACKHHLALDVVPTGIANEPPTIVVRRDDLDAIPHTCALDVADLHGCALEEVGQILSLTRERVRQIEVGALRKLRRAIHPECGDGIENPGPPSTDGLALGAHRFLPVLVSDEEEEADEGRVEAPRLAWAAGFDETTDAIAVDRAWAAYTRKDVEDKSAEPTDEEP